jgi:hypothetical protein
MKNQSITPDEFVNLLPEDRKEAIQNIREAIKTHLPSGFQETIGYGMLAYVVPHTIYPKGYHCDTILPLPFINVASQKNFISVYHMGLYADKTLMDWFLSEYPTHSKAKLDMGKSCIRFKKMNDIPYELIGQLATKMTAEQWITVYETNFNK